MRTLECKPTALQPRYSTIRCKTTTNQKDCEQSAEVPPKLAPKDASSAKASSGKDAPLTKDYLSGKGYACVWKGIFSKSCELTKTLVEFVKPDPTKFTKGVGACSFSRYGEDCNISFAPGPDKNAVACHWVYSECVSHVKGFPVEQLPKEAIVPKPEGKTAFTHCETKSDILCEQRMFSFATFAGKQICSGCRGSTACKVPSAAGCKEWLDTCVASTWGRVSFCE